MNSGLLRQGRILITVLFCRVDHHRSFTSQGVEQPAVGWGKTRIGSMSAKNPKVAAVIADINTSGWVDFLEFGSAEHHIPAPGGPGFGDVENLLCTRLFLCIRPAGVLLVGGGETG